MPAVNFQTHSLSTTSLPTFLEQKKSTVSKKFWKFCTLPLSLVNSQTRFSLMKDPRKSCRAESWADLFSSSSVKTILTTDYFPPRNVHEHLAAQKHPQKHNFGSAPLASTDHQQSQIWWSEALVFHCLFPPPLKWPWAFWPSVRASGLSLPR